MKSAHFWFDPVCPWTYVTYQWLDQARHARGIRIAPRLLSLYFLNQGRPVSEHTTAHRDSLQLERFLAFVRAASGGETMLEAYDSLARALFQRSAKPGPHLIAQTANVIGWEAGPALAAAADDTWDATIRADHDAAVALVGDDVGSPVIALEDGPALFGPVFSRAPRGEDAGRLWDAFMTLSASPDFFELKRTRGPEVNLDFG
ncbi:MAG: DsbA family protein [Bifidobacteriaceae bacterium]|nr:DsbA family protein [Bifidobacteriaceae bacterium]